MPSVLFDRVGQFFSSLNPDSNFNVRVKRIPVEQTEARLTVRINATEDALIETRQLLEDEKTRARKWERRAVVASADLAAARGSTDEFDRLQKRLDVLQHEKTELEHRVTRLNRMLTVAEEQRGVAIARLAGFAGGIEDVQEENRILKGTVAALESEVASVKEGWQTDVEEMEMELREWKSREASHLERVKVLEGKLESVAIDKSAVEEKLSIAEAQLLDGEADRCLVHVLGAEKERLLERIEEVTQTAEKVPGLENDNQRLKAEVRDGQRRLEGLSKLLLTMKKKNDKLVVVAREKDQYGESMAQMFADMKKECERLRRERDDKARLCENMTETHSELCLKQEEIIETLQVELGTRSIEATAFETNLKQLQTKFENKESEVQEYIESYNRIACLMNMTAAPTDAQPDLGDLEATLSSAIDRMHDGEAQITALQSDLNKLRKENEGKEEKVQKLSVEIMRANKAQTEMKGRIDVIQDDNIKLHERGAAFEAEVNKLTKTNNTFERRMEELVSENSTLQSEVDRSSAVSKKLQEELNALFAKMQSMQISIASEREELAAQLAERTAAFTSIENELKDARETYRTAAKKFEERRLSLTRRLTAFEQRKEAAELGLVRKERLVNNTATRIDELFERCQQLEEENDGLKEAGRVRVLCDDDGDVVALREMLAESEREREHLTMQMNELKCGRGERRLSSSSVSSDEDMARRVQELEITLEEEAKEKEAQKQQLCEAERNHEDLKRQVTDLEMTAKEKEKEAEKLRGEMASIYSKMRKMACVSLPPGAEELLDDEDDLRRLNEIREATRREENARTEREKRDGVRESRKLPAQKRKLRMGVLDNKTRFRV